VTHAEGDASAFDERKVGLNHVAFRVSDLAALEAWANRLDALGVTHSGVQDVQGDRGGPLIVLREPDQHSNRTDRRLAAATSVNARIRYVSRPWSRTFFAHPVPPSAENILDRVV
jgi:catechol 2,3-dioxygenase-like lactoylglutathione lyase family enzyme